MIGKEQRGSESGLNQEVARSMQAVCGGLKLKVKVGQQQLDTGQGSGLQVAM